MDAGDAVDELLRVSEEVRVAVLFARGGEPLASNVSDDEATELAGLGEAMLAYAETLRPGTDVRGLHAVTPDGDIYVAREGDRAVVSIAAPGSLTGLVEYDLRTLLGSTSSRRRKAVATA